MNFSSISLYGITFHTYGFILGLAVIVGVGVADRLAKITYGDRYIENGLGDVFGWVLGFGILGARAYHVIDFWNYYSQNIWEVFYVWNGGLGIYGGIVGGIFGLWVYLKTTKKKSYDIWMYLDVVGPGLLAAQAIGRLGNYFNQELYGKPTKLAWKIFIYPENRLFGYEDILYYHPIFLYEMIWNLLGALVLYMLMIRNKVKLYRGNYFLIYLIWYGLGRSLLEYLRIEIWSVWGIPVASLVGTCLVIGSVVALIIKSKEK